MKTTYFDSKGNTDKHFFFWQPWNWGCLGRLLLFLIMLFALILLLGKFTRCQRMPCDPDATPISDIGLPPRNIDNPSENLPDSANNFIPPYEEDDVVTDGPRQIVGNRLNVMLDADSEDEVFNKFADEFKALYPSDNYKITYYDPLTKLLQITVPASELQTIAEKLPEQITDISFKVFTDDVMGLPANDMQPQSIAGIANKRDYLKRIQMGEAWTITQGSPDIKVAIVDSYFDLNHPAFEADRVVKPYSISRRSADVSPDTSLPRDDAAFFHGTLVASVAVGAANEAKASSGIAPKCRLMPVSLGHRMTSMTILQGILYAIYQKADVINISAGWAPDLGESMRLVLTPIEEQAEIANQSGVREQDVWEYAFRMAKQRNITIVWAAGNFSIFTGLDPSKRDNETLLVTAVGTDMQKSDFTNYGYRKNNMIVGSTISAPGVKIMGAVPNGKYAEEDGTSFAAPIVAGAVALMKSIKPDITNKQIISILQQTGKSVNAKNDIAKVIQVADALKKAKE